MTDTIIDLIRHGEPVGGRAYRGHNIDDPLSDKGWQQMWDAVGDHCPWDRIISSPLSRCLAFAECLADKHSLAVDVVDNFKEVGFGEWEGKTPDELKAQRLAEYNAFYQDPVNLRPPGAENLDTFFKRVNDAIAETASQHNGQHILIVAHAGVIRAVIAAAVGAPKAGMYKIKVTNGGITRLRIDPLKTTLEYVNNRLENM